MKYLIFGLGNIGQEYHETRHNIGFMALDYIQNSVSAPVFTLERHAFKTEFRHRGRTIILLKPTTYMNLSGKAIRYWMDKEKVKLENVLIMLDDVALPVGALRMRITGSDGGHNGLTSVIETLGTNKFNRLRIGIGSNYSRGKQIDYVLGKFSNQDLSEIEPKYPIIEDIVKSFSFSGMDKTMNLYNGK